MFWSTTVLKTGLEIAPVRKICTCGRADKFRFDVDAHTAILAKRFYTLWADCCLSRRVAIDPWLTLRMVKGLPSANVVD
jgi:hypothetical protein